MPLNCGPLLCQSLRGTELDQHLRGTITADWDVYKVISRGSKSFIRLWVTHTESDDLFECSKVTILRYWIIKNPIGWGVTKSYNRYSIIHKDFNSINDDFASFVQ